MSMDAAPPVTDKRRELAAVAKAVSTCTACSLSRTRTNAVPGEGAAEASIVFVGEGPGFYEDQQGRPFVGASGKFLDELLRSIGMDRKTVFITNVVKCRPPENRDPQPDEIEACSKHLEAQLTAIAPKVVVTLGRHSMQRYFPGESIGRIHGQPRRKGDVIVVPMYHPAAALHQEPAEGDRSRLHAAARVSEEDARAVARGSDAVSVRPAHTGTSPGSGAAGRGLNDGRERACRDDHRRGVAADAAPVEDL